MKCYCCDNEVSLAHHVKLRGDVRPAPPAGTLEGDPAYHAYRENGTYRSAFVCPACYAVLDSWDGTGEIGGRVYGINGRSRRGRAAVYNQAKYEAFRRKKAAELGIDPD